MSLEAKRRAFKKGLWAESAAALLLMAKGYRIVGRRVRTRVGEIDLIAKRGGVLAFVEVKARASLADAADSLGWKQRARIERAASAWCAGRTWTAGLAWRFDTVLVGGGVPRHVADAWRPDA